MGKRTLVHITQNLYGRYKWTGKNAECCIMAVKTNGYVSDVELKSYVADKTITSEEYSAIEHFDFGNATDENLNTIQKLAERLKLRVVVHKQPTSEAVK